MGRMLRRDVMMASPFVLFVRNFRRAIRSVSQEKQNVVKNVEMQHARKDGN
jgi:hypothetical protein